MAGRIRRLYDSLVPSGNGYKVRLLLSMLDMDYALTELDFMTDPPETGRQDFLAVNPNGKIPAVELEDGSHLWESGAILFYIAEGTPFWPSQAYERAKVLQWMFFEQYSHEPYVAVYKFWRLWGGLHQISSEEQEKLRTRGQRALEVMNIQLGQTPFLAGERLTIADIALFAYSQSAERVGFDIRALNDLRLWLDRVREQPGFIPIHTSDRYPELP